MFGHNKLKVYWDIRIYKCQTWALRYEIYGLYGVGHNVNFEEICLYGHDN